MTPEPVRPSKDERVRTYEIGVCAICASDNIFSTDSDSWCDDCKEWMNCEVIEVAALAADTEP